MTRVAVLDDYQDVARVFGDWDSLGVEVVTFTDHLDGDDEVVERLRPFDVVMAMRERTPFPRARLERLPNLRLLVTTRDVSAREPDGFGRGVELEASLQRALGGEGLPLAVQGARELREQVRVRIRARERHAIGLDRAPIVTARREQLGAHEPLVRMHRPVARQAGRGDALAASTPQPRARLRQMASRHRHVRVGLREALRGAPRALVEGRRPARVIAAARHAPVERRPAGPRRRLR